MYNGVSPIRLFKAARDVSNHCPDWFCGPACRHDDRACAAGARADRQYFFRSRAAPARQYSPRQSAQPPDDEEEVPELPQGRLLPTPNRPPPGQGVPPPGAVQSQPLAPPPGTTVVPQNAPPGVAVAPPQPGQGVAVAPPGANPLPGLPPGQRQPKGVPQSPADAAARRRGGHRAAGAEDRQQEGELLRPRQDHRAHHQFRRGYRRDRPVRRAAGQDRRLLHASGNRSRQHRRLCRGRRDHAAGRGEADLFGLDVRGKPRPARRRASDLRYLADRLQRPGHHRRHRAARSAEAGAATAAAGAEACAPPKQAARARRRRSRSSSSSRRRHRRRRSNPAACSGFSGSGQCLAMDASSCTRTGMRTDRDRARADVSRARR